MLRQDNRIALFMLEVNPTSPYHRVDNRNNTIEVGFLAEQALKRRKSVAKPSFQVTFYYLGVN